MQTFISNGLRWFSIIKVNYVIMPHGSRNDYITSISTGEGSK